MTPNSSGRLELIAANEPERWNDVLRSVEEFDFYHYADYHRLYERKRDEKAIMFTCREGKAVIAWPFVLRNIEEIAGLEEVGKGYRDAISVYGYPGPIYSTSARNNKALFDRFCKSLIREAAQLGVVAIFSRLNPILENWECIESCGVLNRVGETVYIDLTQAESDQVGQYRRNHRDDIRIARALGFHAYRDIDMAHRDEFVDLYHVTMSRVGASPEYFFEIDYFLKLRDFLGEALQLFVVEVQDRIFALDFLLLPAGLFNTICLRAWPIGMLHGAQSFWWIRHAIGQVELGRGYSIWEEV